jgi:hypothetical protein
MEYTETPQQASPEILLKICDLLLDEGNLSVEEISGSLEPKKRQISDNITYGLALGFLKKNEEGEISITNLGADATIDDGSEKPASNEFREGIMNYPFCRDALSELAEKHREDRKFTKSDIKRVFRTTLGVELSGNTMTNKITTFLNTLDSAGLGEYMRGSGGKESRLELNEGFQSLYDEMFAEEGEEEETTESASLDREEQNENLSARQQSTSPQPSRQLTKQGVSFEISLELSGDEDPEQVEELITSVRRGMNRNVNETEENRGGDTTEKDPTQESDETEETGEIEDREPDEPERSGDETEEPEETESEDIESEAVEQNETEEEESEQAGEEDYTDSTSSLSEF